MDSPAYETVVGLEVHAQLSTQSKLFCGDGTLYGAPANTQTSAISLAHPGTLPKLNRQAIEYAISLGLACQCQIEERNYFARKNYFYADLPKGYQVTQHTTPICRGGEVMIRVNGIEKKIRLNRIHLEEDAGKSIHDTDPLYSCLDFNRAGTALVEIVTEPDLRSGDEAFAFLSVIRRWVRYLGICDGNMEQGSLRCDANISVRKKGENKLGVKTEIKNLNSIRNVKRAIEAESRRMIIALEKGEQLVQQTRSFNAETGLSLAIREKEDADDYRYFPEPDLPPFLITHEMMTAVKKRMPLLPEQRARQYMEKLQLPEYDAEQLVMDNRFSDYFNQLVELNPDLKPKALSNWMLGPVRNWLNENGEEEFVFPLSALKLGALVRLVEEGVCSFTAASGKLFGSLLENPGTDPLLLAKQMNLLKETNSAAIEDVVEKVLVKMEGKVKEYKKGKKGLMSLFVGEVMKVTGGKADPKLTTDIIQKKLNS